jgi:hypothetical protein
MTAKITRAHTTIAALMPTFAPVERPLFSEEVCMIGAVGLEVGRVAVFEG